MQRWQSLLATDWAFLTQTQQGRGPLWCALATLLGPAGPFPQIQGTGCCCCCFTRQKASANSHTMLCGVALHTGRAASAWRDCFLSAFLRSRCKEQAGSSCFGAARRRLHAGRCGPSHSGRPVQGGDEALRPSKHLAEPPAPLSAPVGDELQLGQRQQLDVHQLHLRQRHVGDALGDPCRAICLSQALWHGLRRHDSLRFLRRDFKSLPRVCRACTAIPCSRPLPFMG